MGSFSLWHLLVVLLALGAAGGGVWLIVRARTPAGLLHEGGFRDPARLTAWTNWMLYALLSLAVVALISDAVEFGLLQSFARGAYDSRDTALAAAQASDTRQQVIGITQFVTFFVSGVFILKWIYRANLNAHRLGAQGMEFSPGWSIGWYFIPFANLFQPFRAMKEIWRASQNPVDWRSGSTPALLGWWWFVWIVSNIAGNISFRISTAAHDLDTAILASTARIFSDAVDVPLCLILLSIVKSITAMQTARHAEQVRAAIPA